MPVSFLETPVEVEKVDEKVVCRIGHKFPQVVLVNIVQEIANLSGLLLQQICLLLLACIR